MRHATALSLALLAACPAAAECVDLSLAPPTTARFEDGIVIGVLSREGGVLYYRVTDPGQPVTEMRTHLGTVPLWSRREETETAFVWDTPLPALGDLVPGASFELTGKATQTGNEPTLTAVGVFIGDWQEIEVDGCPVRVLRSVLRYGPPDNPFSHSERLWDPVTLLAYESTVTRPGAEPGTTETRRYRVTTLK